MYNRNKFEIKEEYTTGIYVEQRTIGFVASYELNIDPSI